VNRRLRGKKKIYIGKVKAEDIIDSLKKDEIESLTPLFE